MNNESPNLILVKVIVALYLNTKLSSPNGKVLTSVNAVLKDLRLPADSMGESSEGVIAHALKNTIDWILTRSEDTVLNTVDILGRIRMNSYGDMTYSTIIEDMLSGDDTDELEVANRIKVALSEISYVLKQQEVSKLFFQANKALNFGAEAVDQMAFISEFSEKLRNISVTGNEQKVGFGGKLSTDDPASVVEVFEKTKELQSTHGVLKTGLTGLNKALGIGGYRRGEYVNYGALTHNYKSGILLDHCRWFPIHNEPHMLDPIKKPLVLRISFENKLEQDLPLMYRSLWEAEHQKKCDIKEIDPQEAAAYVLEKLGANGYHYAMECYDPNNFDVWDLIDILNGYEADGYEVHALICDYPSLLAKGGATKRLDEEINGIVECLRNHCFTRGITVIAAHQLSTEAQQLSREGTSNFTLKVSVGGYYQNSKSLATKFDGEFVLHIHKVGDESYLSFSRGKHRGGDQTPISHRTFAYKFEQYGGICDDINDEVSKAIYNWGSVENNGGGDSGMSDADASGDESW